MHRFAILAIVAGTTACGDVTPEQTTTNEIVNQAVVSPAEAQGNILALPEPQRLALFANAIRDAGQDCQEVESAEAGGTYRSLPVWRATCRDGTTWTIVVGNDNVASVLNPNEAALIANEVGPGNSQ